MAVAKISSKKNAPAKFKSLTLTQKRIAIAEDVIAGLESKRYKAVTGSYIKAGVNIKDLDKKIDAGEIEVELKDVLSDGMKSCQVCALGAMFIASVEKFDRLKLNLKEAYNNKVHLEDLYTCNESICDHLVNYFTGDQMDLIEEAFEGPIMQGSDSVDNLEDLLVQTYWFRFKSASARMTAIMQNIIDNNGKFIPSM